jgi:hypothetical protein
LTTGVSLVATFAGKASHDSQNAHGATQSYATLVDWTHFENPLRGWGLDGGAFADPSHRGPCTSGNTCRVWDWSILATDTTNFQVNPLPGGSDTVAHAWLLASAPGNQADCDAGAPGSTFVAGAPNRCETSMVINAVEVIAPGSPNPGNRDLLCEAGELCLHSQSIGSDQGAAPVAFSLP